VSNILVDYSIWLLISFKGREAMLATKKIFFCYFKKEKKIKLNIKMCNKGKVRKE